MFYKRELNNDTKEKLDIDQKKALYQLYQQKELTVKAICEMFKISKPTLYKVVEKISKQY